MMRTIGFMSAVGLAAICFAPSAHADTYVGLDLGTTANADASGFALPDGNAAAAYIGTGLGPVDVEFRLERAALDILGAASANALEASINASYGIDLGEKDAIAITGGVGYLDAEVNFGGTSFSGDGTDYRYGVRYTHDFGGFNGNVSWTRHTADDVSFDGFGSIDLTYDTLMAGLSWSL